MSKHMREFFGYAFREGDIIELRAMMRDGTVVAGRFTDLDQMARVATDVDTWVETSAVYFCLNPIDPMKASRIGAYAPNTIKSNVWTTRDADVIRRRLYLLDFDPVRAVKGTCSTDGEKQAAYELMHIVVAVLREAGFPEPIIVDSGNGYHVYYLGDGCGPSSKAWTFTLKHLSATYSNEAVKIDTVVGNASRISRLPGTWNRKGENTPERPHRRCKVLSYPDVWKPLPHPTIYKYAHKHGFDRAEAQRAKMESAERPALVEDAQELLEQFIAESEGELEVAAIREQDGATYFDLKSCPFAGRAHRGALGKTSIILTDAFVGFHCFSDDCEGLGFGDLRQQLERLTGHRSTINFYERTTVELTSADFAKWGINTLGEDTSRALTFDELQSFIDEWEPDDFAVAA